MSSKVPTLTETLHCTSMRCTPARCVKEAGLRKPSQQRTREKCLHAHLRTYTQPAQLLAAGAQHAAHSQSALRTGLMAPTWRPHLRIWGVILDLT